MYLLLWWRTKFTGLAGSLSSTHGKSLHKFIVALPLVGLNLTDKLV